MADGLLDRGRKAWNILSGGDDEYGEVTIQMRLGGSERTGPARHRSSSSERKTPIGSVLSTIAVDVTRFRIAHIQEEDGRFKELMKSEMNECFSVSPNKDQTPAAFLRDAALSAMEEGVIAIVPIDTTIDPSNSDAYDILSMRTAKILKYYPDHIRIRVYDDKEGRYREKTVPKRIAAIVENPHFTVMNERNSTLQRLLRKIALLDSLDADIRSGKLDILIQLPYAIRSEAQAEKAEKRRKDIERQLKGSELGIAYTDATEKIVQLNRAAENNLQAQVEYLTSMLNSQLGITEEIMNGTADKDAMANYMARTVEPIVAEIVQAMNKTFLSKTARTRGQKIRYFIDPFALMSITDMAEAVDKLRRNEAVSPNDIRNSLGLPPSTDENADSTKNSNMPQPAVDPATVSQIQPPPPKDKKKGGMQ